MAENTEVGPAGGNKSPLPITLHQFLGHSDHTDTDSFGDDAGGGADEAAEASNVTLGSAGELNMDQYPY